MTKEEERKIIDEIIRIFMEDDDFDIYMYSSLVHAIALERQ